MDDLLQVSEVNIMKLSAISIAVIVAGVVGTASAGQPPTETLAPVRVSAPAATACVPPTDVAGHACDAFDQMLRANFSSREIGMLFGNQTSYPENLTGGIERVQRRYQALLQEYVAQQAAANAAIAVK